MNHRKNALDRMIPMTVAIPFKMVSILDRIVREQATTRASLIREAIERAYIKGDALGPYDGLAGIDHSPNHDAMSPW